MVGVPKGVSTYVSLKYLTSEGQTKTVCQWHYTTHIYLKSKSWQKEGNRKKIINLNFCHIPYMNSFFFFFTYFIYLCFQLILIKFYVISMPLYRVFAYISFFFFRGGEVVIMFHNNVNALKPIIYLVSN